MFAHRRLFQPYRSTITIGAVCFAATLLTLAADMAATAQNRRSKYGLGTLPVNAGSSAGTRSPSGLPRVTMLVPEDGALTLSERPTFYWYVAPMTSNHEPTPLQISFRLRQNPTSESLTTFKVEANTTKTGLYRFTLPPSAPTLEPGTDRGWVIQLPDDEVKTNTVVVRLGKNAVAIAEISKAKNNLEKARIYERYGYWYDAFDAYTKWLEVNPQDAVARRERANMIEVGLKDNSDFLYEGQPNLKLLSELQSNIDAAVATDLLAASP